MENCHIFFCPLLSVLKWVIVHVWLVLFNGNRTENCYSFVYQTLNYLAEMSQFKYGCFTVWALLEKQVSACKLRKGFSILVPTLWSSEQLNMFGQTVLQIFMFLTGPESENNYIRTCGAGHIFKGAFSFNSVFSIFYLQCADFPSYSWS